MDLTAYTAGEAAALAWGLQMKCKCGKTTFLGAGRLAAVRPELTCAEVVDLARCASCGAKGAFAYIKADVSARDQRDRQAKAAEDKRLASLD